MSVEGRIAIRSQILSCTTCKLSDDATPVPFSGPSPNPFVVIGEAPGATENKQHLPFVGPAGQLLRRAINSAFTTAMADSIASKEKYSSYFSYLNVVSCFPSGTPTQRSIKACGPNLWGQLEVIAPSYGLLVGGVALGALIPSIAGGRRPDGSVAKPTSLSQLRGLWVSIRGSWGTCMLMVTWHPAAILREPGQLSSVKGRELSADLASFASVVARWIPVHETAVGYQPSLQRSLTL